MIDMQVAIDEGRLILVPGVGYVSRQMLVRMGIEIAP
jgi:hypothetical protein